MRNTFNEQLERLHVELIQMGATCEDAISAAAEALLKHDQTLAATAEEAERELDRKEREVENLCLKLLLQQQPVARDLREISAALKMISDLERIGDQAADIAELTRFVQVPEGTGAPHIADMARAVIAMVTDSVDSFVKRDLDLARAVCKADDKVDALFQPGQNALHHCDSAAQHHGAAAPWPCAGRDAAGHPDPLAPHAGVRGAVAAGHRPCLHRHGGEDCGGHEEGGPDQGGHRPRKIS